jgi:hypothetical protein
MLLFRMGILKRQRHEIFAREYLACENGAEAYRRTARRFPNAGPGLNNPGSAGVMAWKIMRRPEVKRRILELRTIMAKKADITLDKVLTDIQEAIQMAKAQAKPNELVTAAMAQAKLVGLLRERIETGTIAEYENLENSALLQKLSDDVGPEAAMLLAKKWNLGGEQSEELAQAVPPTDAVN